MKKLEFTIPLAFCFPIFAFNPTRHIGKGWKYSKELHGPAESDGITSFQEMIVKAAALPNKKGKALLFASGLKGRRESFRGRKLLVFILGNDRLQALADRIHTDPNLLWSLYKEKGQKTLRYLYYTYGVGRMESLRRIIVGPKGHRYALWIDRDIDDGSWSWCYVSLDMHRTSESPALVFG